MADHNNNIGDDEQKPTEHRPVPGQDKSHDEEQEIAGQTNGEEPGQEEVILPESDYQSVKHFLILSIFSFGIYPFFWFYKHWRYLKDEKNMDISPGFRTLFIVFSGYSLFRTFQKLAREKGYQGFRPLRLIFLIYTSIILACTISINPPPALAFLALFSCFLLIPALNVMNFYYQKEQEGYRIKQRLGLDEKIFLGIVWIFMLVLSFIS